MRGTFRTVTYNSRSDFERKLPSGVFVSTNRFTDTGLDWMWKMMLGQLRNSDGSLTDHLGAARLLVGNGEAAFSPLDTRLAGNETAQAAMDDGYPLLVGAVQGDEGLDAWRVTFLATFGERDANFEWAERGVVTAQGVLIDRSVQDQGRKVLGAIWTLEASLDLDR